MKQKLLLTPTPTQVWYFYQTRNKQNCVPGTSKMQKNLNGYIVHVPGSPHFVILVAQGTLNIHKVQGNVCYGVWVWMFYFTKDHSVHNATEQTTPWYASMFCIGLTKHYHKGTSLLMFMPLVCLGNWSRPLSMTKTLQNISLGEPHMETVTINIFVIVSVLIAKHEGEF